MEALGSGEFLRRLGFVFREARTGPCATSTWTQLLLRTGLNLLLRMLLRFLARMPDRENRDFVTPDSVHHAMILIQH